jgi:GTP-binding protein HflX
VLPLSDDAMSLVSWFLDHAYGQAEDYAAEEVVVDFEARPSVIERARAKAEALAPPAET